jgi:hypothetical protein
MNNRKLDQVIERRNKVIPDPIWLVFGAVSGLIAGHVVGQTVFKISIFRHTTAATIAAVCLVAAFILLRKRLPELSGGCLWLGTFSIGLLTLR